MPTSYLGFRGFKLILGQTQKPYSPEPHKICIVKNVV